MNIAAAAGLSDKTKAFLSTTFLPFVDGEYRQLPDAGGIAVYDPATGTSIAEVPNVAAAGVDQAVAAARAALNGAWAATPPAARESMLLKLADLIQQHIEPLSQLETLENGKSIGNARAVDVSGSVQWLRYMAGWATKIEGSTLDATIPVPPGAQHFACTIKEPVGVVGAIVPWNFPLLMAIWKIAPALTCGCTIVLKPAEETPLTALYLGQLINEAGFPKGVVNIVTGDGPTTGAALAKHPGIDKLTFTGSTEVGKLIGHAAVDNLARFTLELGGKSPMILFSDMDENMEGLLAGLGMFFNQGQVCTAATRVLIDRKIYDKTLAKLGSVADGMSIGSGLDPKAQINPLVSKTQQERVAGFVERAKKAGASLVAGNRSVPGGGYFVAPTILAGLTPQDEAVRDEIFGPVIAALPFDDLDEAIRIGNDSRYGLAASVWTRDLNKAFKVVKSLKAGTVWVNSHNTLDPNVPFGGMKQSGIGREHGRAALDGYLETKSVIIRYG
jgi:phenylacetaldehyde dehydrogenase